MLMHRVTGMILHAVVLPSWAKELLADGVQNSDRSMSWLLEDLVQVWWIFLDNVLQGFGYMSGRFVWGF